MKRAFAFIFVTLVCVAGAGYGQDQDPDKILEALIDRLMHDHIRVRVLDHEEIRFTINERARSASMAWNGNLVAQMRLPRIEHDRETGVDLPPPPKTHIVHMIGNAGTLVLNTKTGKLYFSAPKGRMLVGSVDLTKRSDVWTGVLRDHEPISIDLCLEKKSAACRIGPHTPFRMTFRYFPIKGSPDRKNVIEMKGNAGRPVYLNQSKKVLYFRDGVRGDFAQVEVVRSSEMAGHRLGR